jgi:hypothetical protein
MGRSNPSLRAGPPRPRGPLAALALGICGCAAKSSADLPSFDDVDQAPAVIQTAAQAVVLVNMPTFAATAVFISPDGLLLTNNHVMGVSVCPVQGCYANITFDYQRGTPVSPPTTVFVVPKAVNVGLDMAVLQASMTPGGPPLATPSYVTLDARDPAQLLGTHVNVVGHPEDSIKKWSAGEIVDTDGAWVTTTAFDLPGNSGSPMLDDHGHLVAILHRGAAGLDLVTSDGLNDFSIGTASSALIAAMSQPLPASMWSTSESTTSADVAAQDLIYLTAHQSNATVDGASEPVLASLGAACDAALAVQDYVTPEDLTAGLQPCFDAEGWIQCAQLTGSAGSSFGVCPDDPADWQRRYQAIFEYWLSFNGELELDEVSFAIGALSTDPNAGVKAGAQALTQALSKANPPLDFVVAQHLAAFDIAQYQGTSIVEYVQNYKSVPDYALEGEYLVNAIEWLDSWGLLTSDQLQSMLAALHGDSTIDLGTKLLIEQIEYGRGILP